VVSCHRGKKRDNPRTGQPPERLLETHIHGVTRRVRAVQDNCHQSGADGASDTDTVLSRFDVEERQSLHRLALKASVTTSHRVNDS
jgi:hypothetical protein